MIDRLVAPSRDRDARQRPGGEASARGRARDARARPAGAGRRDGGSDTTRRRSSSGKRNRFARESAASSFVGAFLFDHGVTQRAAQPSEDRGTKHEGLHRGIVCFEHLVDEEIDDVAAPAAEPAHERVSIVDCPEREGCEVEPGGPALGPLDEIVDVLGLEPELQTIVQETVCLGKSEAEVLRSHLEQFPVRAQRRQREGGLAPRCNHELERRGGAIDEPRHTVSRRAAREPVKIVENQRGIAECRQLVDKLRQEGVHDARRSEQLCRRGHSERRTLPAKCREDVGPEHDRVVVAFVEAQPCNRPPRLLRVAPDSEQRRLAVPGRRGDERDLRARAGAKPLDQTVARERLHPPRRRMQLRHQQRSAAEQARAPPSAGPRFSPVVWLPGPEELTRASRRGKTAYTTSSHGRSRRDVHPGEVALGRRALTSWCVRLAGP